MRKTREAWLMAGIHLLTRSGKAALRVETLCQELGVTKGSFYHHFHNLAEYETALLGFYEQVTTLDLIAELQNIPDPRTRFRALIHQITLYAPDTEIALRAWARQDPQAAALQAKLDHLREQYVLELVQQIVPDPEEARLLARGFYWMYVGTQQAFIPHNASEKQQILQMMLDRIGL